MCYLVGVRYLNKKGPLTIKMVSINIGRREAIFFGAIILVFLVAGLAIAYGGNTPAVMGHSLGEVSMPACDVGEALVKTGDGWNCGSAGPMGDLVVKYGTVPTNVGGEGQIIFPESFPTEVLYVAITPTHNTGYQTNCGIYNLNKNNFSYASCPAPAYWFAFGK